MKTAINWLCPTSSRYFNGYSMLIRTIRFIRVTTLKVKQIVKGLSKLLWKFYVYLLMKCAVFVWLLLFYVKKLLLGKCNNRQCLNWKLILPVYILVRLKEQLFSADVDDQKQNQYQNQYQDQYQDEDQDQDQEDESKRAGGSLIAIWKLLMHWSRNREAFECALNLFIAKKCRTYLGILLDVAFFRKFSIYFKN